MTTGVVNLSDGGVTTRTASWAGSTLADRQAARREKLLAAGQQLIATGGGPAASVRAVCREAGVTERYFYENFTDRDDLVLTVFGRVEHEVETAVVEAVSTCERTAIAIATAAVDAVVGLTIDQPDKGRVLFVAPMTDPVLYGRIEAIGPSVTDLIATQLSAKVSRTHRSLVAASLAGALAHLFHQYVAGHLDVPREAFVEHCVRLLLTLGALPEQPAQH